MQTKKDLPVPKIPAGISTRHEGEEKEEAKRRSRSKPQP